MSFLHTLSQSGLEWIPIIVFTSFILIAIIIGMILGWRAALFFTTFHLLGLIIGLFALEPIWGILIDNMGLKASDYFDANYFLKNRVVTNYLVPFLFIFWFLGFQIVAAIIYIFVRKYLKSTMKIRKESEESNALSRAGGALISVVGVLPIASFATNSAVFISNKNSFNNFSDALVTGSSFSLYKGFGEVLPSIHHLLDALKEGWISNIYHFFDGTDMAVDVDFLNSVQANFDKIQVIFSDKISVEIVSSVLSAVKYRMTETHRQEVIHNINGLPSQQIFVPRIKINVGTKTILTQFFTDKIGLDQPNIDKIFNLYFQS